MEGEPYGSVRFRRLGGLRGGVSFFLPPLAVLCLISFSRFLFLSLLVVFIASFISFFSFLCFFSSGCWCIIRIHVFVSFFSVSPWWCCVSHYYFFCFFPLAGVVFFSFCSFPPWWCGASFIFFFRLVVPFGGTTKHNKKKKK